MNPASIPVRWEVRDRPTPHAARVREPHEPFYGKKFPLQGLYSLPTLSGGTAYCWKVPGLPGAQGHTPHFTVAYFEKCEAQVPLEEFRRPYRCNFLLSPETSIASLKVKCFLHSFSGQERPDGLSEQLYKIRLARGMLVITENIDIHADRIMDIMDPAVLHPLRARALLVILGQQHGLNLLDLVLCAPGRNHGALRDTRLPRLNDCSWRLVPNSRRSL